MQPGGPLRSPRKSRNAPRWRPSVKYRPGKWILKPSYIYIASNFICIDLALIYRVAAIRGSNCLYTERLHPQYVCYFARYAVASTRKHPPPSPCRVRHYCYRSLLTCILISVITICNYRAALHVAAPTTTPDGH